jgi:hypothetical protein
MNASKAACDAERRHSEGSQQLVGKEQQNFKSISARSFQAVCLSDRQCFPRDFPSYNVSLFQYGKLDVPQTLLINLVTTTKFVCYEVRCTMRVPYYDMAIRTLSFEIKVSAIRSQVRTDLSCVLKRVYPVCQQ